jgi:prepilin-type N-terminal cleavage/methylation domain-containing protein
MRKLTQNNAGFSLLELMIAIAILALVMVPIAYFYTRALRSVEEASIRNRALEMAQERINEIKGMPYDLIRANNRPSPDDIELNNLDPTAVDVYNQDNFMYFYPLPLGYNPYRPDTQGYDNSPNVRRRNNNNLGDTTANTGIPVAPFLNITGDQAYEYEPVGFYTTLRRTDELRTTDPRTNSLAELPAVGGSADNFRKGTEYRRDLYSIYGRRTIIMDVLPDPADSDGDIYPSDSPLDGGASALDPYPPAKGPDNKYQIRSKYGMKGKLVVVQVYWLPKKAPERMLKKDELSMVELKTFVPASNVQSAGNLYSDLYSTADYLFISTPTP